MEIFPSATRVFYNPDCAKYGVEQITKGMVLNGKQLYKWHQVLIHKGKVVPNWTKEGARANCYTPYKAVAERWADQIRDKGVIEVRADMEAVK